MKKLICSVCDKNEAFGSLMIIILGVCCVPSVPCSMAYCKECLEANAHPWWILVANTACCNGLHNTTDFWKWMVADTCEHLGKTLEKFNIDVQEAILQMENYYETEVQNS